MDWLLLAGSLAGVLALAAAAWLLGLGGRTIGGGDEATRLAEEAVIGLAARAAYVSRDGKAALVAGSEGEVVLLKVHGANVVTRRLERLSRIELANGKVTVISGERLFGDLRLDLAEEDRDRLLAML